MEGKALVCVPVRPGARCARCPAVGVRRRASAETAREAYAESQGQGARDGGAIESSAAFLLQRRPARGLLAGFVAARCMGKEA